MKRINKTVYTNDEGRELLSLKNDCLGKVHIERYYFDKPEDLEEMSSACLAAAEELRATTPTEPPANPDLTNMALYS